MASAKDYKCGHRSSPGPGGIRCRCCTKNDKPAKVKRKLNKQVRRKRKQRLKKEPDET